MKKYLSYLENKNSLIGDRRINVKDLWLKNQKPFTENEAIDFIQNNCKEFLENPVLITIRITTDSAEDFFYSKAIDRHSLDNLNFYNLIIDNSPLWTSYPKRLKSFCCTLYGTSKLGDITYFVIPVDNSKWGLCTSSDIFVSFKYMLNKIDWYLNDFFDFLHDFVLNNLNIELNDVNYNVFKEQINTVEIMLDKDNELREKFLNRFGKYDTTQISELSMIIKENGLFNTIENLMNPKINNFEICTLKDMYNNDYVKQNVVNKIDRECWTESPCIFIKKSSYNKEFFAKLNLDFVECDWRIHNNYIEK